MHFTAQATARHERHVRPVEGAIGPERVHELLRCRAAAGRRRERRTRRRGPTRRTGCWREAADTPTPRWLFVGVLDWRSGLPYSSVNEYARLRRSAQRPRFPTYVRSTSASSIGSKCCGLRPWIGVRIENALNSCLPIDVQGNIVVARVRHVLQHRIPPVSDPAAIRAVARPADSAPLSQQPSHISRRRSSTLAALGVVYGDIGTSPLYALRECFCGHASRSRSPQRTSSASCRSSSGRSSSRSSVKYLLFVHARRQRRRRRHPGAGRAGRGRRPASRRTASLVAIGLFGAALLYGDGMITPAISVLSAVEGLGVATHVVRAVRRADHGRHPDRPVHRAAPRHRRHRRGVRADHDRVVPRRSRARRPAHRRATRSCSTRSTRCTGSSFLVEQGWRRS